MSIKRIKAAMSISDLDTKRMIEDADTNRTLNQIKDVSERKERSLFHRGLHR